MNVRPRLYIIRLHECVPQRQREDEEEEWLTTTN